MSAARPALCALGAAWGDPSWPALAQTPIGDPDDDDGYGGDEEDDEEDDDDDDEEEPLQVSPSPVREDIPAASTNSAIIKGLPRPRKYRGLPRGRHSFFPAAGWSSSRQEAQQGNPGIGT